MKRADHSEQFTELIRAARRLAVQDKAVAMVILAELPYDFASIEKLLRGRVRLVVATDESDVQQAAEEDGVDLVKLRDEPQARYTQLSQALLEAIADDLLQSGDRIVAIYSVFEREQADTISMIHLSEHLSKLTARDLRKLKTNVPLDTLKIIVDLAVEIGREGRENKPVGALFVVGDHQRVLDLSHEGVHDPFRGYTEKECNIRDARVRESIKELAQIDGAFVFSSSGIAKSAGRILSAPGQGITLSQGLGSRHWAAAAITKATNAIAIAVSQSTRSVRIFQNGSVVLRIEPMNHAMKYQEAESEGPDE